VHLLIRLLVGGRIKILQVVVKLWVQEMVKVILISYPIPHPMAMALLELIRIHMVVVGQAQVVSMPLDLLEALIMVEWVDGQELQEAVMEVELQHHPMMVVEAEVPEATEVVVEAQV
jgi:hypothetical protein